MEGESSRRAKEVIDELRKGHVGDVRPLLTFLQKSASKSLLSLVASKFDASWSRIPELRRLSDEEQVDLVRAATRFIFLHSAYDALTLIMDGEIETLEVLQKQFGVIMGYWTLALTLKSLGHDWTFGTDRQAP